MNSQAHLVDLDGTALNQGEHANEQPPNDDVTQTDGVASAEGTGSSDHIADGTTATGAVPHTTPDAGNTGSTGTATPSHQGD